MAETGKFDPLIHAPNRLQICALLDATAEIEFKVLRDKLSVSDSVLSKQLKCLEEAKYLIVHKRSEMGRQRSWLSLSSKGRQAFHAHVAALKAILGQA
ncbi:MarR family transcriptional regulator [Rheinheimera sp. SA_1]|uniref:transcriptional regulator n=1 Tax=Rheinheimera sp. SA_1 TaxID=1827365 RepID=UPI0007FECC84|nr:transcriptional regulator [Rheinheimera sp. SA_1]OBP13472.1 MarR family transcriptional regulator [Rheinheimera sp. SA_1]